MKKQLKWLIPIVIIGIGIGIGIVLITLVLVSRSPVEEGDFTMGASAGLPETMVATATSSTGKVIYDGAVFLERIIVGLNETSAGVTLTDTDTTVGPPPVFFDIRGDTLQGVYEIGLRLHTGILYTASTSTNATLIFIPMGK